MPRGKRKTCGEKLEELREQIDVLERQLQELKTKEKVLLQEKREKELKQIAEILEERNLTVEELPGLLDQTLPLFSVLPRHFPWLRRCRLPG